VGVTRVPRTLARFRESQMAASDAAHAGAPAQAHPDDFTFEAAVAATQPSDLTGLATRPRVAVTTAAEHQPLAEALAGQFYECAHLFSMS